MRQLVTKYQPPGVVNKTGEIFVDEVTGQIKIGDGSTVNGKNQDGLVSYNTTSGVLAANGYGVKLSWFTQQWRAKQREVSQSLIEMRRKQFDVCEWEPNTQVSIGMARIPSVHKIGNNSFALKIHRCTTSGITGSSEPVWATNDAILSPGATSQTVDGTAVWTAYNLYHFDSDNGNDTTGDGSQLTPYRTFAKATIYGTTATCTGMSGRAWCLKRGCVNVYTGTQAGSTASFGLQYARDASIDTMLLPQRFNIFAYGSGQKPSIDSAGKRYGLRCATSSATQHHGFLTVSDINFPKISYTADDGGYGVSANSNTTPGHTNPLHIKLFRLSIQGYTTTAGTSNGSDCDGIWLVGRGVGVYECDVHDVWDDGVFANSSDGEFIGNRVWDVAKSTQVFPDRERGDIMQINSTLTGTPAHNLTIVGNYLSHASSGSKQGLICNPDSGGGASCFGYTIAWNEIYGTAVDNTTHSHHALYVSSFVGTVANNLVYNNGYGIQGAGSFFGIYGKDLLGVMVNNVVLSAGGLTGTSAGIYYEASILTGSGVAIEHNTVIGVGGEIEYGIRSASGVTVVQNNCVMNASIGLSALTGCTHRNNGYQYCSITYNGTGSYLGGNVTGNYLLVNAEPVDGSALQSAGILGTYADVKTDCLGRVRPPTPTIGAVELYE